jgi:hypothetical protein
MIGGFLIYKSKILIKDYCVSNADCGRYCCSSCANKEWINQNIDPTEQCCYTLGGAVTGCSCVNNKCNQVFG